MEGSEAPGALGAVHGESEMPYFDEMKQILEEALLWADLRHEQGIDIRDVLRRLRTDLRGARQALKAAKPSPAKCREEPVNLRAIRALRPPGPRRLGGMPPAQEYEVRLRGAWLGRAAGCTLGAPVESWPIPEMAALAKASGMAFPPTDYWADHPDRRRIRYSISAVEDYLVGALSCAPPDDDLTYTLVGLLILEAYGPGFSTDDVGRAWLDFLPEACTAEKVALDNLRAGVPALRAALRNNPYQEWIGADIRSDPWGYAAPNWPQQAAEMAYRDALLTHRGTGLYGAMFFAAAIAAAFSVDDPVEALRLGLTEIPRDCRLAKELRWALRKAPGLAHWREARTLVDQRFPGMHPVHTINNACLTIFALHLGQKDFTRTIGISVALGLDNDCTAATAGSILGAVVGEKGIPAHWWKPFRNRTRTYIIGHEWFSNTDIVVRFQRAAERTHALAFP